MPPAESDTRESWVTWKSTKPWSAYQRGSRSRTSSSTLRSSYSPFWNHQKPSGRVDMCFTTALSEKCLLLSTTTWLMATRSPLVDVEHHPDLARLLGQLKHLHLEA